VYDTHSKTNERDSAVFAWQELLRHKTAKPIVNDILDLIYSTKHLEDDSYTPPIDCTLIKDIDLSILGASSTAYQWYARNIREEYSWVPEKEYIERRIAVIQHFDQMPQIYKNEYFKKI
jgi:predicted metal-dependent HD superfamily phosphohydrolase